MITTFGNDKGLRIGTWNVRTLYQDGKIEQACAVLKKYNMALMGMCEVRWNECGQKHTPEGYAFYWSGMPNKDDIHQYGVGILVNAELKNAIIDYKCVNERIMTMRFKGRQRNVSIIQCYAPTEDSDVNNKDAFYDQLNATLLETPENDFKILMGDFNAKVGNDNTDLQHVIGKYGIGQMNDNGQRLVELCGINELKIGGTLFPHKGIHKITWVSPDSNTENQIDHICVSAKWSNSLCDVRNRRGADIGSDHHLVIGKLSLNFRVVRHKKSSVRVKYQVNRLKSTEQRLTFYNSLREKFDNLDVNENIDQRWTTIKNAITATCYQNLGRVCNKDKSYISAQSWALIDDRANLKNEINACRNTQKKSDLRSQYRQMDKRIKRSVRDDKNEYIDNLATQAESAAATANLKDLYEITKQIANKPGRKSTPVKDRDGELLTNVDEQLRRWKEHFENILNMQTDGVSPTLNDDILTLPIRTDPPTTLEINEAIKALKNGKSAGIDNIPAEVLKGDSQLISSILHPLFRDIWVKETIPNDWLQGLVVKLHKKGDASDCNNWRGITLLSAVFKVFMRIILERMLNFVDEKLRREQAGFRSGRSCVDQINTLRIIIEQAVEFQSTLYVLFVDYEKAFDSVNRECIWTELKNIGVPEKIVKLIRIGYDGAKNSVIHCGKISDPFHTVSGVRQGCLLSPLLFLIVIDAVSRRSSNIPRGIIWDPLNPAERLESLDYADDKCELAHRQRDMQDKLNDLVSESRKVGLKINTKKTKEMRINSSTDEPLQVMDVQIERVTKYQYLGSIISEDGGAAKDVDSRIRKALGAYITLNKVWKNSVYSLTTKIKIFKSCVLSVLLYGCETWCVTTEIKDGLRVFVNRCLRRILGIWWPNIISNELLWMRTDMKDVNYEIRKRKFGWIGHTLRKPPAEICRQALTYNPQGSRRRGRPKTTWRRSTLIEVNSLQENQRQYNNIGELSETAMTRERWKLLIDSLCPV